MVTSNVYILRLTNSKHKVAQLARLQHISFHQEMSCGKSFQQSCVSTQHKQVSTETCIALTTLHFREHYKKFQILNL